MVIHKLLTPYNYDVGNISRIKYIVIHYVGSTGSAQANCKYYASQKLKASAHYYCNFDGSVWQSVEDKNIAWHCGAKKYVHPECRNANSIGIELCVRNKGDRSDTSKDWYFEDATVQAAIQLTKELMSKYHITPDHVIRHYDVTGKICPNPFVYNHTKHTWSEFKAAISSNTTSTPSQPELTTYDIKTGKDGVKINVSGTLNIRSYPVSGSVIGTLSNGTTVHPTKKTFVSNGDVWYYLPDKDGWISAKYIDGGWVYECSVKSSRKWWYIHKGYTCTTNGFEVINGLNYAFDAEGYMYENEEIPANADADGVVRIK